MLSAFSPLTDPDCDRAAAELTGYEFLATLRAAGDGTDLSTCCGMIESAERVGGPEALAMTRVLAVVGPEAVRPAATAVAARLVAVACPTRRGPTRWVGRRPGHFGYSDLAGAQEVIALPFSYGRRQHAVSVLIDHQLGGGVKDCYVAGRPRLLRRQCAELAEMRGASLHDYSRRRGGGDPGARAGGSAVSGGAGPDRGRRYPSRPAPVPSGPVAATGAAEPAGQDAHRSVHRLKIGLRVPSRRSGDGSRWLPIPRWSSSTT